MTKAIVCFGSKQYEVSPGAHLLVDRLGQAAGESFESDKILWAAPAGGGAKAGRPYVSGASVVFETLRHIRGRKVIVFKKRSKKAWKKTRGHRSDLTELLVKEIKI